MMQTHTQTRALAKALKSDEDVLDELQAPPGRPVTFFSQGLRELAEGAAVVIAEIQQRPDFFDAEAGHLRHFDHREPDPHHNGHLELEDLEFFRQTTLQLRQRMVTMGSHVNMSYTSCDVRGRPYQRDVMQEMRTLFPKEVACVERLAELVSDYALLLMKPAPDRAAVNALVKQKFGEAVARLRNEQRNSPDGPRR